MAKPKKKRMDYYTKLRIQAFGIIGAGVLCIAGLVVYAVYDEGQWTAFAAENDCKIVAQTADQTSYGWVNGKMSTTTISGTKTYRCADGVDYTR